jgi:glycyl-tRNA synthetase beta chain
MPELLLELLSEEIPARMQARAAEDLKRLVCDRLKNAGLTFDRAEAFVTPRRLALVVVGVSKSQPDVTEERRGPRVDAPETAIEGFLKSTGLTLAQCERRETEKGMFYFGVIKKKGRKTLDILPDVLRDTIWGLPWSKSMKWGADTAFSWVRPMHGLLCLFDGVIIQFDLQRGIGKAEIGRDFRVGKHPPHGLVTAAATLGHRFLAPKPLKVKSFADYKAKLKKAKVILDPAERRAIIAREATKLANGHGLSLVEDDNLMNEVIGLVEWPVVLMGRIDDTYMDLPPEVLSTTMRHHQKYFSLRDRAGKLAPRFIVVAGTETKDKGKAVVAGNERVLRARLSDAKFFWDHDRKKTLESRVPALKERVFHAKLGSDFERVARLQKLAVEIARFIPDADPKLAERTALLCKADLTTGMVGEFPELQGVMGHYYALHDRENPAVADAIAAHYSPLGPNDACPTAPVSVTVALADKIDTLVGFFAIDEKPTGSKDPFALRRAALGVIRLIVENRLRMPLMNVFAQAFQPIGATIESLSTDAFNYADYLARSHLTEDEYRDENIHLLWDHGLRFKAYQSEGARLANELLIFFADRLKVALRDKGVRHDLIDAVFAVGGEDDLVRLLARVEALENFLRTDDGANLLVAYRRAANILRIEEKKDGQSYAGPIDKSLLTEADEKRLYGALDEAGAAIRAALGREDFAGAMTALARLRAPVDSFFDKVTVNCDDRALRANRLRLLSHIRSGLGGVADFSKIEGEPRK